MKLFVLKTINLAMLVYQLFLIQSNANTTQQYLRLPNYADYLAVRLLPFATCWMTTCIQVLSMSRVSDAASTLRKALQAPYTSGCRSTCVCALYPGHAGFVYLYTCLSVHIHCTDFGFYTCGCKTHMSAYAFSQCVTFSVAALL